MTVSSILKDKGRDVATITPEASLQEAVNMLAAKRIGAIVVTDFAQRVSGILSERDIVRATSSSGCDALKESVSAHMTREVVTCSLQDSTERLMEMMTAGRMRHLPVTEDGKLTGIISIGDVVKRRIADAELEAESLKAYIASG
ncbi:CBS domain-containing protein [Pyruvatibacter sp. HU-CL02332]|uniref:CBS domain-containing protein n=1 Tax=Pyruvatibacter sp. HU-CL02332 TaxID=3127650 RepID=UPI002967D918|nr:CBS domain-containing protein [Alphaproteobacteria bacterium]